MPRLLKLLLPSWRLVLAGILLSLFALLANLGLLALSSWFIASMAVAGSLGAFMDDTLPAAAVRALALARASGRYAERLVNHDATLRILSTLRVWFFRRIEPLAPAQLSAHRSGDLLSRIRADVDTLDDFYVRGVVPAVVAVLAACCIVAFLASFDMRLAGIDLAGLAIAGVALPLLLHWRAAAPGRRRVEYAAELRASVVEQTQGMAELIVLGAVQESEARLGRLSGSLDRAQAKLSSLQGIGEAGLVGASSLAVWAAAFAIAPLVLAGTREGPQFAMLTVFVLATFEAVMPLPAVIQRAGEIAAAARRLFDLIDARPPGSRAGTARLSPRAWRAAGPLHQWAWFPLRPRSALDPGRLFPACPDRGKHRHRRADGHRQKHAREPAPAVLEPREGEHRRAGRRREHLGACKAARG